MLRLIGSPDAARCQDAAQWAAAESYGCTVLADGSRVTIRPITPDDRPLELAFVRGLSRQTRYQRLLSARDLAPDELRRLVEIDRSREQALIATVTMDDGSEDQVGVARYVRDSRDGGEAEVAIVVADAWQRRGLGDALLRALFQEARADGIELLYGITQFTNRGMLRLAQRLGFRVAHQPGDATLMRIARTMEPRWMERRRAVAGVGG